ncbi:MAG: hypothetical protein JWN75_1112 [Candidatus Saccharibacteria bacterium]|nr:hypothetical protein [Candidatus Saccharibacteria bacterium]
MASAAQSFEDVKKSSAELTLARLKEQGIIPAEAPKADKPKAAK